MNATTLLEATPANLRTLRTEAGLSQNALAELVYLSGFARISDWERGKRPIDPARWELLLVKLDKHRAFKRKT